MPSCKKIRRGYYRTSSTTGKRTYVKPKCVSKKATKSGVKRKRNLSSKRKSVTKKSAPACKAWMYKNKYGLNDTIKGRRENLFTAVYEFSLKKHIPMQKAKDHFIKQLYRCTLREPNAAIRRKLDADRLWLSKQPI